MNQPVYSPAAGYTPGPASPAPQPAAPSSSSDPAELLLSQFPSTSKLTREDLEELLRNPAYFDAYFGTLPQVLALEKEHEEQLHRNIEMSGMSRFDGHT